MVGLSTQIFDLDGAVILEANIGSSELRNVERRVSRRKTLDGGAVINDIGFSDADRTFKIKTNVGTIADVDQLSLLLQNYNLLTVTTDEGAFSAAPQQLNINGLSVSFTLLVKEKISA